MRVYSTLYSASSSTDIGFGIRHWPWYLLSNAMLNIGCTFIPGGSSNMAALHPIICSTLNGPIYLGKTFTGLSYSFRCFIDNSMLSPGPKMFFFTLCLLTACHLLLTLYAIHGCLSIFFISLMDSPLWQVFAMVIPQCL